MASSIKPTIGRKVWFWSGVTPEPANANKLPVVIDQQQAMDATIVLVGYSGISLSVTDHAGNQHFYEGIQLWDPDTDPNNDRHGTGEAYATWMPYQVGQARAAS